MMKKTKVMIEGAMDMETELLIASLEQPREYLFGTWRFGEGM
jgi:adenosylhomocysteine nucleosidase